MAVVKIELDVDPGSGETKIRMVGTHLDALEKKGKQTKDAMGKIMEGFQVGAGIAAMERLFQAFEGGIGWIMGAVRAQDAYVSGILKVTAATDLSARSQAILQRAGEDSDVAWEKQLAGLGKLAKVLEEQPEKLGRIGLSYQNLRGLAPEEQFQRVGEAIAGIEDPMKRLAVAQEFFGEAGRELIPLFTGAIGDAREAVDTLGLSITDLDAQNIDALNNSLDLLDKVGEMVVRRFVALVASAESVHVFVEGLTRVVADLSKAFFANEDASRSMVDNGVVVMVKGLTLLVDGIMLVIDAWDALILTGRGVWTMMLDGAIAGTKLNIAMTYLAVGAGEVREQLRANLASLEKDRVAQGTAANAIIEANTKRINALGLLRSATVDLEKTVTAAAGKTRESIDIDKTKAGTLVGLGAAATKAAAETEKAMAKAKEAWDTLLRGMDSSEWKAKFDLMESMGKKTKESLSDLDKVAGTWIKDLKDLTSDQDSATWEYVTGGEKHIKLATETTIDWADALDQVANAFQTLGLDASNVLVNVTTQLAAGLAAAQRLKTVLFDKDGKRKAWSDLSDQDKMAVGLGGIQTAAAAYNSGSFMGGAAGGAAYGSAFGGVGAIVGGVVGGLLGLFGKGKKNAEEERKLKADTESGALSQLDGLLQRWQAFKSEQLEKGVAGVNAQFAYLASKTDVSTERLQRMGSIGLGMFGALRAQGLSMVDAMAKMGPMFDDAIKIGADKFGAHFAEIAAFRQKILDNQELVTAAESLGDVIDSLRTFGKLTAETFGDVVAENSALIDDMLAKGFSLDEALNVNAKSLYAIYRAQKDLGLAVDETTQKYLDQAEKAGLFENMKDPMEELVEIQKIQLQIMAELVKVFGGSLPESVRAYLAELDKIPAKKTTEVETRYTRTGDSGEGGGEDAPGDPGGPQNAAGSLGLRDYGMGTRATLHGEEAVLTRSQINNLIRGAAGSTPRGGAGAIYNVHVSVPEGTTDPEVFGRRVAVAVIDGLKENTEGLRERVRAEVA